jgi:hypothetical protein
MEEPKLTQLEQTYLPFSEKQLNECLAVASCHGASHAGESEDTEPGRIGIGYYKSSIGHYLSRDKNRKRPISKIKGPRQIEKDERFWTAATLLAFRYTDNPRDHWAKLFSRCLGLERPPVGSFATWEDAIGDNPVLLIEAPMPSPQKYNSWLRQNLSDRQIIPYVCDAIPINPQDKLEGFTHADAIVINQSNHFAVVFESKVLADISTQITFDCMRNQIARIIDVMLEEPNPEEHLSDALSKRKSELTCFVLLTPRLFQQNPWSRLYGHLIREYQQNPQALARDLPHRNREDWPEIARRLGWLTWEDCNEVLPGACKWLKSGLKPPMIETTA